VPIYSDLAIIICLTTAIAGEALVLDHVYVMMFLRYSVPLLRFSYCNSNCCNRFSI